MKKIKILIIILLIPFTLFSQNDAVNTIDTLRKDALNVYMNASSYLKKEVPFINYVRDKEFADLIIIDTRQRTGSGGYEYTYFIEGQYKYAGIKDTITLTTSPDDTEEQIRLKSAKLLKMGLMKYIIGTPLAEFIDITFSESVPEEVASDKWKNWVFRARISSSLTGKETSNSLKVGSMVTADMVTSKWKLRIGYLYNNSRTVYDYNDTKTTSIQKSDGIWGDIAKSLNDHWSVGLSGEVSKSIYTNYDLMTYIAPAIEYDIFPYSVSTRRIFRIYYFVNLGYNNYSDTTQFFKTEEVLWYHRLQSSYTTIQKWGDINIYAGWSNYLHDFSLNRFSLQVEIDLKITKGLRFNIGANYSFIHDQISLRKGNASIEDVLLDRQELSTTFSYGSSFGITYTFGSIYNNVVNPRLDGIF